MCLKGADRVLLDLKISTSVLIKVRIFRVSVSEFCRKRMYINVGGVQFGDGNQFVSLPIPGILQA
jgi:hypothetical protein